MIRLIFTSSKIYKDDYERMGIINMMKLFLVIIILESFVEDLSLGIEVATFIGMFIAFETYLEQLKKTDSTTTSLK